MEEYFKRPSCKACRHFAKKRNEKPDCDSCLPTLAPENIEAAKVFPYVYDQWIINPMGKIIALDLNAVFKAMEVFEIRNKKECLNKIRFLFNEMILEKNK